MRGMRIRRDRTAEAQARKGVAPTHGSVPRARAPATLGLGEGARLPTADRHYFERRFGADLSDVRLHEGPHAAGAAARMGARAFAAGRDVGLGAGVTDRRTTLAHEIAHVLQQGAAGPAIQLDDGAPAEAKKEEEEKPDPVTEGLKTVAEKAKDNEKVKKVILDPLKKKAEGEWGKLSGGEKGAVISFGAVTYGLGLGSLLSSPEGRELLSGTNLIPWTSFVPYATLSEFSFTLAEKDKPLKLKFGLDATDLLKLGQEKFSWMPKMSLKLDLGLDIDPLTDNVSLSGLNANFTIFEGFNLKAGTGIGLPPYRESYTGPDGQTITSMKSVPGFEDKTPKGTGFMFTVDLAKLSFMPPWWKLAFGGGVGKARQEDR